MARKRGRAWQLAHANAELRYGPQERALGALVQQARSDLKMDRRLVSGQAASTIHGARQSRRQLHKIYSQAASGLQVAHDDVEKAFGTAGVGDDNPFALASDRESAAYRQRLTSASASARKDTVDLENQARLGKLFGYQQARQKFMDTRSQIRDQARQLGDERAVYTISELAKSREAAAGRRNARTIAQIQQGFDPKTGKPIPGSAAYERLHPKAKAKAKFKPASRSEGRLFNTDYAVALDYAKAYADQGKDRSHAEQMLRRGKTSNAKKGTARVPQVRNQDALAAALDVAYQGYVSPSTQRKLHAAGIEVRGLQDAKTREQYANRFGNAKRLKKRRERASRNTARQYQQGKVY
jgi:hypothetical protein